MCCVVKNGQKSIGKVIEVLINIFCQDVIYSLPARKSEINSSLQIAAIRRMQKRGSMIPFMIMTTSSCVIFIPEACSSDDRIPPKREGKARFASATPKISKAIAPISFAPIKKFWRNEFSDLTPSAPPKRTLATRRATATLVVFKTMFLINVIGVTVNKPEPSSGREVFDSSRKNCLISGTISDAIRALRDTARLTSASISALFHFCSGWLSGLFFIA